MKKETMTLNGIDLSLLNFQKYKKQFYIISIIFLISISYLLGKSQSLVQDTRFKKEIIISSTPIVTQILSPTITPTDSPTPIPSSTPTLIPTPTSTKYATIYLNSFEKSYDCIDSKSSDLKSADNAVIEGKKKSESCLLSYKPDISGCWNKCNTDEDSCELDCNNKFPEYGNQRDQCLTPCWTTNKFCKENCRTDQSKLITENNNKCLDDFYMPPAKILGNLITTYCKK